MEPVNYVYFRWQLHVSDFCPNKSDVGAQAASRILVYSGVEVIEEQPLSIIMMSISDNGTYQCERYRFLSGHCVDKQNYSIFDPRDKDSS